jgi:hypothetical protein
MKLKRIHFLFAILCLVIVLIPFRVAFRGKVSGAIQSLKGRRTVADRMAEFGDAVRKRLEPQFKEAGVAYPPKKIQLVGLKQERVLELWAKDGKTDFRHIKTYPFTAASGVLGPKLQEGDLQVPEGLYEIESLNPNSAFHAALRVGYPNKFDKEKGKLDRREFLGSDIMIHGGAGSIGCIAIGDTAVEEVFAVAALAGIQNVSVILSPLDLRIKDFPPRTTNMPPWTPELYAQIQRELKKLPPAQKR